MFGVGYDRPESDDPTDHVLGPTFEVELPVFDRNEAGIARAESELARLARLHEALVAEVAQQVRAAADRAALAARSADMTRRQLLPQAERSADLSRQAYTLGDTTLLARLEADRQVVQARMQRVETALEAALAQVELVRAVGVPTAGRPGDQQPDGSPD